MQSRRSDAPTPFSAVEQLYSDPTSFNFYQAVRLLERLQPERGQVGRPFDPRREAVRFGSLVSLSFPPSAIATLVRPKGAGQPWMTVAFMGLVGPSGVLPRHYTEMILRLERESRQPERKALRDWFDLFNNRFIAFLHRAWSKYRLPFVYEQEERGAEPDPFTLALSCLIGQGTRGMRGRLVVRAGAPVEEGAAEAPPLARIDDRFLLFHAGLFAQKRRPAAGLEILLEGFFGAAATVASFRGQWLRLEAADRTRLGAANSRLGRDAVAGDRVWEVQGRFEVRLGPLDAATFDRFLPDRAPESKRKEFFLLVQLVRLYVGPEFDFSVRLVLERKGVPQCQLGSRGGHGVRLGWNSWLQSKLREKDADEAVFEGRNFTVGAV